MWLFGFFFINLLKQIHLFEVNVIIRESKVNQSKLGSKLYNDNNIKNIIEIIIVVWVYFSQKLLHVHLISPTSLKLFFLLLHSFFTNIPQFERTDKMLLLWPSLKIFFKNSFIIHSFLSSSDVCSGSAALPFLGVFLGFSSFDCSRFRAVQVLDLALRSGRGNQEDGNERRSEQSLSTTAVSDRIEGGGERSRRWQQRELVALCNHCRSTWSRRAVLTLIIHISIQTSWL